MASDVWTVESGKIDPQHYFGETVANGAIGIRSSTVPFHSEKTPSFTVHPDKGFFHCFGCGAGGDVFKFLELHEKLPFPDAVKLLAHKFGVALPELKEDDDARRDASLREALLKVHELAAAYFREQLASPAGARARQQLRERELTDATIDQLGIGFAPPARAVVVTAAPNDPTLRTSAAVDVAVLSTRKSAGSVDAVVAVAGTPMPSKF